MLGDLAGAAGVRGYLDYREKRVDRWGRCRLGVLGVREAHADHFGHEREGVGFLMC
jgi:hypothetical protein